MLGQSTRSLPRDRCNSYAKSIHVVYDLDGEMVASLYSHCTHLDVALPLDDAMLCDRTSTISGSPSSRPSALTRTDCSIGGFTVGRWNRDTTDRRICVDSDRAGGAVLVASGPLRCRGVERGTPNGSRRHRRRVR